VSTFLSDSFKFCRLHADKVVMEATTKARDELSRELGQGDGEQLTTADRINDAAAFCADEWTLTAALEQVRLGAPWAALALLEGPDEEALVGPCPWEVAA
jgi:hypothetical protein